MKSIGKTNTSDEKRNKMTLKDYFRNIPRTKIVAPRCELIRKIAEKCNVPETTARSWFVYGIIPRNEKFIEILSEETGIPVEDMWENETLSK